MHMHMKIFFISFIKYINYIFRKYNNSSSASHSVSGTSHSNSSMGSAASSSGTATTNNNQMQVVEVENGTEADDASALDPNQEEWTYDPNEPKYCLCNQVSYGDMVACDNEDVCRFIFCVLLSCYYF